MKYLQIKIIIKYKNLSKLLVNLIIFNKYKLILVRIKIHYITFYLLKSYLKLNLLVEYKFTRHQNWNFLNKL